MTNSSSTPNNVGEASASPELLSPAGVTAAKAVGVPLIFAANLLAGLLPMAIERRRRRLRRDRRAAASPSLTASPWLSLASCFSAGVFLASCFVGLVPSVRRGFERLDSGTAKRSPLPLTELCLMAGFFGVWALDLAAHRLCSAGGDGHSHGGGGGGEPTQQQQRQRSQHLPKWRRRQRERRQRPASLPPQPPSASGGGGGGSSSGSSDKAMLLSTMNFCDDEDGDQVVIDYADDDDYGGEEENEGVEFEDLTADGGAAAEGNGVGDDSPPSTPAASSAAVNAVLLTVSMGAHSLLEGVGVGVSQSAATAVPLLVAMLLHECLCSLSLGVALLRRAGLSRRLQAGLVCLFSALIPIGLAVGIAISAGVVGGGSGGGPSAGAQRAVTILQGFAAGTFAYVIFLELLPPELVTDAGRRPCGKFVATVLGFGLVAAISLGLGGHGHGGGGS